MLIPDGDSSFEVVIKKSRFIAETLPAESPEAARAQLKAKRFEHPDAAHVVHAFITGEQRQFMGMSDDGEPSGTSGKPVLEILKGRGITNIMLTVVRYFGGTKLGTGGLVKAYSAAAAGALDELSVKELVKYRRFEVAADYHFFEPLRKIINGYGCRIDDEAFGTAVVVRGIVPELEACKLESAVIDISSGRARIIIFEDVFQA